MPCPPVSRARLPQDAEDLLESYFIQADYVLRRLLLVSERIDDVEDLGERWWGVAGGGGSSRGAAEAGSRLAAPAGSAPAADVY